MALFYLMGSVSAIQAAPRTLAGHVVPAVRGLTPLHRLSASRVLNLAIGLPCRDQAGLSNLLERLYDPTDPGYRHFLTPAEFSEQFGPTEADYEKVRAFVQAQGLNIIGVHPNRLVLDVSGSVTDIERAFQTELQVYAHPRENRTFFAPAMEPAVAVELPIQDVSGLNDYALPRPMLSRQSSGTFRASAQPQYGSASDGGYAGYDFRAAYVPGVTLDGAGQAVALLEFDGYYASDITTYLTQAGLPNVPLQNVLIGGYNGAAGVNNIEVALDIEVAIAMAPGLAKVIVYEEANGASANTILSRIATDNLAKQISCSWSWGTSSNNTTQTLLQQMATQGQSFFVASGDSGAYTGVIDQPCDSPYLTSVGGTTLSTSGPGGAWAGETAWNWLTTGQGTSGSSGGISTFFSRPTWQQGLSMTTNQGSTTLRNIPDVAMAADNIHIISDNGSASRVGGTSAAAPLWAGFTALVNQQAANGGLAPVGLLNSALYNLGKSTNFTAVFHDITTGNNTNSSSPTRFLATPGYDLCTGLGTPKGSNLINALAPLPKAPLLSASGSQLLVETCGNPNGVVDPDETVTVSFSLMNKGVSTTNLVATLLTNSGVWAPSAPQVYGVVPGLGGTASQPFTFTARGACGGSISATLQLQDGAVNLGTVSFAFVLGKFVGAPGQNFDGVIVPALPVGWSNVVVSGASAPG